MATNSGGSCFVMMPFQGPFNETYKKALVPAIRKVGLVPIRGDEIYNPGTIMHQVFQGIRDASVCVADLSRRNPNVMYELGLAHAIGKAVVQIGQTDQDLPFDLRHNRFYVYDTSSRLWASKHQDKLVLMLNASLSDPASSVVFAEAGSANSASALDRILRTRTIRAGCIRQPPLLDYATDTLFGTRASGLYANLMDHIATVNDLAVRYVELRFSEMISAVRDGKVDLVLCTFPTFQRLLQVDFAAFLHAIGVAAIVRKNGIEIRTREDLLRSDVRVAVLKGEVGWEYALSGLKLTDTSDRLSIVESEQISSVFDLVVSSKAHAALADALSCSQYVAQKAAAFFTTGDTLRGESAVHI